MNEVAPLVSVVMPAYKVGPFIAEALASVAAQTYANWEVLVVDDRGPDDGMVGIVRRFAAEHPDHRVELITHEENKGVSAARNTAIAAATGELIAFLDPDDHWFRDHLERVVARFGRPNAPDVVTGPVEFVVERQSKALARRSAQEKWHRTHFPDTLAIYNYIQPSATVLRRSAMEAVGGFDTDPELQHIEDYDLWIRMVDAGFRFAFLNAPTSSYRWHAGGATADVARMRRLDERLVRKHAGFFRRSTTALHKRMLSDIERMDLELAAIRRQQNGPVMRALTALDRLLRWCWNALRNAVGKG